MRIEIIAVYDISWSFTTTDFTNSRLLTDSSRGITGITYNNDGLPLKVSFTDMSQQEYEWDGLGNHVATRFYGVSYTGKQYTKMTRKYTGDGRVIDNNVEQYAQYPGGYMQASTYYFYIKDYQGNNIAVMDGKKNFIQQTDYYPYGEPWKEPTGQPWLYSGNERLRLDGINEYDFNARRFNSVEGRFSSWDAMNEKYPWLSPYAYCGGDPVNAIDKDGKDIVVLNLEGSLHTAMLIQNNDKTWSYYSINGNNKYSSGSFTGGRPFNEVGVGNWDSPEDFFKSSFNSYCEDSDRVTNDPSKNKYAFTEGYYIPSTPCQDEIMRATFEDIAKETYNLFFNNCTQAVQRVMHKADIPISECEYKIEYRVISTEFGLVEVPDKVQRIEKIGMVPSSSFKSIMNANPNGRYLRYERHR